MKIAGIIAEYNPFHNGHAYQIEAARKAGATHVICVMSGNFTQRGDVAIMDKLARTRCALSAGADLVLELPTVYSLSSASHFARGGVEILRNTGCVDMLHFGSECGNVELLKDAVYTIIELEARQLVDYKTNTVASARTVALREYGRDDLADLLESPNNLLGVEYIMALKKRYSHIQPQTVARTGTGHDSALTTDTICSATQLRRFLTKYPEDAQSFWPESCQSIYQELVEAGQAPITLDQLNLPILSRLRMVEPAYLAQIAGVCEGLENRLYGAIREGKTLQEIADTVKTKRYPLSKIRRILLCAALGITAKDVEMNPAYLRVLGQNEKGNEILRVMTKTATLPIIAKAAHFENLSKEGKRQFRLENLATDLYTMAFSPMGNCGTELTRNIYSYTKGGTL